MYRRSSTESAPYLIELVASSWTTRASVVAEVSPTRISGTETGCGRQPRPCRRRARARQQQVAEESRPAFFLAGDGTDEVVSTPQSRQSLRQIARHLCRRRRRARRDCG